MKKIVLATHNKHKCEEFREMLKERYEIISLDEIGLNDDIPETGSTFRDNALQKAQYVMDWGNKTGLWKARTIAGIMADDSGLEVMALDGRPGVYSARYAGEGCSSRECIDKLLGELKEIDDRRARFVTVLAVIEYGTEGFEHGAVRYYEGEVRGKIIDELRGDGGFGYDPVFVPDGKDKTFAELGSEVKNGMSHRANAVKKMLEVVD